MLYRHRGRGALADALRARDEFLSLASHELRTPVAALDLRLAVLARSLERTVPPPDPWLLAQVADAVESSRRLTRLTNELLDVTRLRLGWMALERTDVDLFTLAGAVTEREAATARVPTPIALGGDHVVGRWDARRLDQVASHLVGNALKFGEGGPVHVTVDLEPDSGHARLVVRDEGPGIPLDLQRRIFERFGRGVGTDHVGGLGLGLYVCRRCVEAHGGRISVSSAPGHGSTFTVVLPRHVA